MGPEDFSLSLSLVTLRGSERSVTLPKSHPSEQQGQYLSLAIPGCKAIFSVSRYLSLVPYAFWSRIIGS